MTHIVYASPDYIPPPGVTVLPIDAHPAIVEDRAQGHNEPLQDRRSGYAPGLAAQEIVAILRAHGPLTVAEIAGIAGASREAIDCRIRKKEHLFSVVGRRKTGLRSRPAIVWGIRGQP